VVELTSRDIEIIEFLQKYKCATTTMLSKLFFPSRHACYKTMSRLYKAKKVMRTRMVQGSINCEYIYHVKKLSTQMRHQLTVTWFYYKWSIGHNITSYYIEKQIGDIVPDAIFTYIENGKQITGILEVELSKKGFDYMKYERFYATRSYLKYFNEMPSIFILGNANIPTGLRCNYKVYVIDEYLK
jgi:hypothetical protein